MAAFNHNLSAAAYAAALRYEYLTATTAEHKAAIKAEFDALDGATAVEDRTGVETAARPRTGQTPVQAPRHADAPGDGR